MLGKHAKKENIEPFKVIMKVYMTTPWIQKRPWNVYRGSSEEAFSGETKENERSNLTGKAVSLPLYVSSPVSVCFFFQLWE